MIYTAPPERDEAWSTNYELCRVAVAGGKIETLTADNKAASGGPQFSPDGKHLAYRAQRKAGYEADKWELMIVDVDAKGAWQGKPRSLTRDLDRSVDDFTWLRSTALVFSVEDNARSALVATSLEGPPTNVNLGVEGGTFRSLSHAAGVTAFSLATMTSPPEVYVSHEGKARNVSRANTALLAELILPKPKSVTVKVEGAEMQMWILQAAGLRPEEEMAARLPGPRRPARSVGGRLEFSLEPGAVGGAGLRRRPAQSARQHRLWPEVRR